jgi:hypothetical protein
MCIIANPARCGPVEVPPLMRIEINRKQIQGSLLGAFFLLAALTPAGARPIPTDAVTIEVAGACSAPIEAVTIEASRVDIHLFVTGRYVVLVTATGRNASASGGEEGTAMDGSCGKQSTGTSSPLAAARRMIDRRVRRYSALASCCLEAAASVARSLVAECLPKIFR